MDVDLSPFRKYDANTFNLVKHHMSKFSSERRLGRITSSYRADNGEEKSFIADSSYIPTGTAQLLRHLFFPVWILLALIPEEKERTLTIENIVVAQYEGLPVSEDNLIPSDIIKELHSHKLVGKGSLIIEKLTVVCTSSKLCNINELKEQVPGLGNIEFKYIKFKVAINDSTQNFNSFLEELDAASVGAAEVKIMLGRDANHRKITLEKADMNEISTRLEDDDLDAEVPILEGIYDSPHTMFEKFYDPSTEPASYGDRPVDKILIATLGYSCPPSIYMVPGGYTKEETDLRDRIIEKKNMTNDTAPVYHDRHTGHPSQIINHYTNSSFVICQTTYCNGVIANGATSKAIKWLREKWEKTWKGRPYENLVVLIPYGGQYMEDEMIQIHEATNEGIIIVCAAGGMGGDVVFPAALGTVLSVGVSNSGPKGREVDIHVSEESLTKSSDIGKSLISQMFPYGVMTAVPVENLSKNCGIAAARITGLLALLLSRINSILNSNLTDPLHQAMAAAIKNTPHYLHTCVIRELLVNEGNGSHHPKEGYGDGEKILYNLVMTEESSLLLKLADVLLKRYDDDIHNTINTKQSTEINDKRRKKFFHNLDGSGAIIAVLEYDTEKEKQVELGPNGTTFKPFEPSDILTQHGEQCASVVHKVCPNASILCANKVQEKHHAFKDCVSRKPSIDIISYSIFCSTFYSKICTPVNEAVVAGKIIVFAAGNTGQKHRNTIGYPGRIGNILVVGGRDPHYNRIGFSSVGKEMDFLAEGETGDLRGTSYAAPVVAGYIALLLQFIKENMNTDEDRIRAWSKNSQDEYEWQDIPAFDAAHNVYAMRTLLKLLVPKPQDHSDTEGFGCLDFSTLFPYYAIPNGHQYTTNLAKKKIHETLQCFYKHY